MRQSQVAGSTEGEEGEDMNRRSGSIDIDGALFATDTRGTVYTDRDGTKAFFVEFTVHRMAEDGHLTGDSEIVVIGMLDQDAAEMVRGLVTVLAEHAPNALYDVGLVAAPFRISAQPDV